MIMLMDEILEHAEKFSKDYPGEPLAIYLKTFKLLDELDDKLFPKGNTKYDASEDILSQVVGGLDTLITFAVEEKLEDKKNE